MALSPQNWSNPERDASIDRAYAGIDQEQPRPEVDDAIRAAARRAVRAGPRPLGARLRRWGVPISIAAVVVVSVSLVTLMREEGVDRYQEGYSSPAKIKSVGKPAEAPIGGATGDFRAPVTAPSAPPMAVPQAQPAPATTAEAAPSADDSLRARRLARPADAPSGPVRSSVEEARERTEDKDQKADQRAPEPRAEAERQSAGKKSESSLAAGALSQPARSLASAPTRADSERLSEESVAKSEPLLNSGRVAALIRTLDRAEPEAWLEKIRVLRRENRDDEADAVLAEFKRRFPNHPVPEAEAKRAR